MFCLPRKLVAVLMMLWLPLFSGSALAASVAMQMPQGSCHEAMASHEMEMAGMNSMAMTAMDMSGMDMSEQHHGSTPAAADKQSPSCNSCGICHIACTAYLAVPGVEPAAVQPGAHEVVPYLVYFHSITSAPLLPPPLVRA